jgi:hypothetical protein
MNMDNMNDKISFSMFIDGDFKKIESRRKHSKSIDSLDSINDYAPENRSPLLKPLNKRVAHQWVKDETVAHCYKCNIGFSMFIRKHHCRSCGRIFCYKCCSNWKKINHLGDKNIIEKPQQNEYFTGILNTFIKNEELSRLCIDCNEKITELNMLDGLINIFPFIGYDEFTNLKLVSKKWYKATVYYLSNLREIQYKLPFKTFTKKEKDKLMSARHSFYGHSKWKTCLLRSISENEKNIDYNKSFLEEILNILKNNKKNQHCWSLMCTRSCTSALKPSNIIEVISVSSPDSFFYDFIFEILLQSSPYEFNCYIYIINKFIITNKIYSYYKKIIDTYIDSPFIIIEIYNNIKYFYEDLNAESQFKKYIDSKLTSIIIENDKSIVEISKLINLPSSNIHLDRVIIPFYDNNFNISNVNKYEINTKSVEVKDSASKPVIISLNNPVNSKRILIKKEDLRKDYIISKIINLIDIILKKKLGIDFNIIKYRIFPVDKSWGIIEIVEDAETIYNIHDKKGFSIQNFIMESNPGMTIQQMREKFVRSTAAYCVITYLLGIGDRHLDNIMIHKNGSLFHIDYGYIFGNDPKLNDPHIRITSGMLDAMGGDNSKDYSDFRNLCTTIYECLRLHLNLLSSMMVELIEIEPSLNFDKFENHILKRFEPGLNMIEAENTLCKMINKSHSNSWKYDIIDFIHSSVKIGYNLFN